MSGSQAGGVKARKIADLKWVRWITESLIKDFPADKAPYQPWQGENHVVWSLGHLATTYAWLTGVMGGVAPEMPASFQEAFKPGVKPTADAARYPTLAEVKAHFDGTCQKLLATIEGLTEDQLSAPLKESLGGFASNGWEVLDRSAWHEGWHAGQISSVRRSLGLPPTMGA